MIGILMITHDHIGQALLRVTENTLGKFPAPIQALNIPPDADTQQCLKIAQASIRKLDQGHGVLVLTDIFGSTPSNIAHALIPNYPVKVVTGINLPMLIRVLNYTHLGLSELVAKAISGGREGVLTQKTAHELPL